MIISFGKVFFCLLFISGPPLFFQHTRTSFVLALPDKRSASSAQATDGPFYHSPVDVAVKAGQNVTLTCRIKHDATGHHTVVWGLQNKEGMLSNVIGVYKWPGGGTIANRPRFSWVTQNSEYSRRAKNYRIYDLFIRNTIVSDSGLYMCTYQKLPNNSSRTARLEVLAPYHNEVTTYERDTVTLNCRHWSTALVWWEIYKKDGHHKIKSKQEIPQGTASSYDSRLTYDWRYIIGLVYDIIIFGVRRSDRGVYRCVTRPNKTVAMWRLKVVSDRDPVFDQKPQDTYAVVLKHVTLRCSAHTVGGSKVIARWFKKSRDDVEVYFPFKHNNTMLHGWFAWASKAEGNFDITLFFVGKNDEGNYWCEAWPEHYEQWDTPVKAGAGLRVIIRPYDKIGYYAVRTLDASVNIVSKGSTTTLTCIPKHRVIWLDEEINVLADGRVRHVQDNRFEISSVDSDSLLIKDVQLKDAKKYYCVLAVDNFIWEKTVKLVVTGCPDGGNWHYNNLLDKCYGTSKLEATFGEAIRWCRQFNSHLAMPKTKREMDQLNEASINIWGQKRKLWIGVDDMETEKQWKWADGRLVTEGQYLHSATQQSPRKDYENCGLINNPHFEEDCSRNNLFICESSGTYWNSLRMKEKYRCPKGWSAFDCGELCYMVSVEKMGWDQGRVFCGEKFASIAIMKNERQWRAVELILTPETNRYTQDAWIGLKKTGEKNRLPMLEWVDGTREYWTNRHRGDHSQDGNCVSMYSDGRINTRYCSHNKFVVCQRPSHPLKINDFPIKLCGKAKHVNEKNSIAKDRLNLGAIFDGENTAIEHYPWAVRIFAGGDFVCSGALIGPKTVLTSGHCMLHKRNRPMSSSGVLIGLGSEEKSPNSGRLEKVHMINVHREYNDDHYDLAMIELKREQVADCWNVRPVCLPKRSDVDFAGYKCKVVSWGGIGGLRHCDLDFNLVEYAESSGMLYYSKISHCRLGEWDIGAPLFCKNLTEFDSSWSIVGIFSNKNGRYEEFTYVPRYLAWINGEIEGNRFPEDQSFHELACFQEWVDISCDHGRPPLIKVTHATYGANNKYRCGYLKPKKLGCGSEVTHIVIHKCAGKNRCRFQVTKELFGQPCPNNFAYLELTYKCAKSTGERFYEFFVTICQGQDTITLSCGEGNPLQIKVRTALYSRAATGECPNEKPGNPDCKQKNVTGEIANRCDGKVVCSYPISMTKWGDVCSGYQKQLKIGYNCLIKEHGTYEFHAIVCSEGENLGLSCGEGNYLVIKVRTAIYSGALNGECPKENTGNPTYCIEKDVTGDIGHRCDGHVVCSYPIYMSKWGDPCSGYKKQLRVHYTCLWQGSGQGFDYAHAAADNSRVSASLLVVVAVCLLISRAW